MYKNRGNISNVSIPVGISGKRARYTSAPPSFAIKALMAVAVGVGGGETYIVFGVYK